MWTLSRFSDEISPRPGAALSQAHRLGGFSGPDLFTEAWQDFTDLLTAEDIRCQ